MKKNYRRKVICKIYDFIAFTIGFLAFIIFISEPLPNSDINLGLFFLSKIVMIIIIGLLYIIKISFFTYHYNRRYNKQ